jgi:hypothetical protein
MDDLFEFQVRREDLVCVWYITYTPWFPGDIKPAYPGVYETREPDNDKFYNYFDGENWHWGEFNPIEAPMYDPMPKEKQKKLVVKWRGLSINTEKLK